MKVYDQSLTGAGSAASTRAQESQRTDRTESSHSTGSSTPGGDRVELSGALGSIARAIAASGTSRAGRVRELAAQYQSGAYQTDALATSSGMVAEMLASGPR